MFKVDFKGLTFSHHWQTGLLQGKEFKAAAATLPCTYLPRVRICALCQSYRLGPLISQDTMCRLTLNQLVYFPIWGHIVINMWLSLKANGRRWTLCVTSRCRGVWLAEERAGSRPAHLPFLAAPKACHISSKFPSRWLFCSAKWSHCTTYQDLVSFSVVSFFFLSRSFLQMFFANVSCKITCLWQITSRFVFNCYYFTVLILLARLLKETISPAETLAPYSGHDNPGKSTSISSLNTRCIIWQNILLVFSRHNTFLKFCIILFVL